MFKINNKETITTSVMNKFYTFSSVSIVDFEQVVMFADLNTLLLWVELSFL